MRLLPVIISALAAVPISWAAAGALEATLTPESGSGVSVTFTATFHDAKGHSDLTWVNLRIPTASSAGACWVAYEVAYNDIALANDRGNDWAHAHPGSDEVLQNGQCAIDTRKVAVSADGENLTLRLPVAFKPSFAGFKSVYLRAQSKSGEVMDYEQRGSWNIPGPSAQTPVDFSAETGVHWPSPGDFAQLHELHYDFAVVNVSVYDLKELSAYFEASERYHVRLVAGMYPPPFHLQPDGTWQITEDGRKFLIECGNHASLVKAIYGFNEPYWIDPRNGKPNQCGGVSAEQLRSLRSAIRSVWPEAQIYHDIGDPESWSPSGGAWKPCVGTKFEDQSGVADYVGIWWYPFAHGKYDRQPGLDFAYRASRYVRDTMRATPVFLLQSFACTNSGCAGEGLEMPTPDQMKDWNCSVRSVAAIGSAMSWYVWRQDTVYSDSLARRPELWPLSGASACADQGRNP